ncbi:MAG: molecular chaperone TorD family protein [Bacteroidales bacterium]
MEEKKDIDQNSILKGYNLLLYFAGSMIMYEPVEECVVDFWSKGILTTLPVSSTNPRFIQAASQLRSSCQDVDLCVARLQEDYNKLFSASGLPFTRPVKSSYASGIIGSGAGSEKVSDFYNSYGWKNRSRYNIPDDHLGIELLFLTLLNDKYISIDDEACREELRIEIRRFIEQHILSWVPDWHDRMQEHSGTMSYKGIATLIYASCEDIYTLLGNHEVKNQSKLEFKN